MAKVAYSLLSNQSERHFLSIDNPVKDRSIGALVGLAVGDALGTTNEFKARDTFPPITNICGGGVFNLKPGEWTDDTSTALCLAESILLSQGFDISSFMDFLVRWYKHGHNSVNGTCFDIGSTTQYALDYYIQNGNCPPIPASSSNEPRNGCIMRLSPVAIYYQNNEDECQRVARLQSRATHPEEICEDSAAFLSLILCRAIKGKSKAEILFDIDFKTSISSILSLFGNTPSWQNKSRTEILSTVNVIHTLEAALWCINQTTNFKDAVLLAANLGGDADTVAAVTGQIAGSLYGFSSIPQSWVFQLSQIERILIIANQLFDKKL